jgi:hypothetical protein
VETPVFSTFCAAIDCMNVKWDEPVEFFRDHLASTGAAPSRSSRAQSAVIAAAVVAGLILMFQLYFFWVVKKDPEVPWFTYLVGPALAGLFVYYLPAMVTASRCTIILTEQGIHRNKAIGTKIFRQFWPWDSISELAIENIEYAGTFHRVLALCTSHERDDDILLGLGNTPLGPIENAVNQMGKTLVSRVPRSDIP